MNKSFAPEFACDDEGRVLFPPDRNLRAEMFPYSDPTEHVAKANMVMVRALVDFVSEPGETILDPFAGTGTIMVALTIGRKVLMIELEEHFQEIIIQNLRGIERTVPDADEHAMLIPGDCNKILPLPPGLFQHMIFSPPYASVLKKKHLDKLSIEHGYASAILYTQHPDNIGNLSDFIYYQKMERVYRKFFISLPPGGTMTIIIKDRMEAGKRIRFADRAERDCINMGFKLVDRNKWLARGGGYAQINRAKGLETVDEEDLITLMKSNKEAVK